MPDTLKSGLKREVQLSDTLHCHHSSHEPGNPVSLLAYLWPISILRTEVGV